MAESAAGGKTEARKLREKKLPREFYFRNTLTVARDLLGKVLVRPHGEQVLSGRIVETEAYFGADDAASHAARGRTLRNAVMFGPPGYSYVYFIYGMYNCLNFVTEPEGRAAAVLIRALEPVSGIDFMKSVRKTEKYTNLASGPGKLCQALAIDGRFNREDLLGHRLYVLEAAPVEKDRIVSAPRIGIKNAAQHHWRFYLKENPHVSVIL